MILADLATLPGARIEGTRCIFTGRKALAEMLGLDFHYDDMGAMTACYGLDGLAPRKAAETLHAFCTEGAIIYDAETGAWSHEGHLPSAASWLRDVAAFVEAVA